MPFQSVKTRFINLFKACRGGQIIDTDQSSPEGTIKDFSNFDAKADCEILREMIMAEHDVVDVGGKITDIIAARSNAQRQELKLEYAEMYENAELVEDLKSQFEGQFLEVLQAMFVYPSVLDARVLHEVVKDDKQEDVNNLLEIIFTKSNDEIIQITDAYETLYDRKLASEVDRQPDTCYLSKLFYSLCFANNESKVLVARAENEYDDTKAKKSAETLLGEKSWGSLDSYFYKLLYQRGFQQLNLIFNEYDKQAGKSIEESIQANVRDADLQKVLLSIVKCVRDRYAYFADRLHECIKCVGTRDTDLFHMIISRSEVDLVQIKEAFQLKYSQSLEECVGEIIEGGGGNITENHKNLMVKLCKGNHSRVHQKVFMKSCMSPNEPV